MSGYKNYIETLEMQPSRRDDDSWWIWYCVINLVQDCRWADAAYGDQWPIDKPLLMLEPAHGKPDE